MAEKTVSLADAKAHLSELVAQASAGESVMITRRGRPVARLCRVETPRQPIDSAALQRVTDALPEAHQPAVEVVRELRDGERY